MQNLVRQIILMLESPCPNLKIFKTSCTMTKRGKNILKRKKKTLNSECNL